jgi:hypothetical protein
MFWKRVKFSCHQNQQGRAFQSKYIGISPSNTQLIEATKHVCFMTNIKSHKHVIDKAIYVYQVSTYKCCQPFYLLIAHFC